MGKTVEQFVSKTGSLDDTDWYVPLRSSNTHLDYKARPSVLLNQPAVNGVMATLTTSGLVRAGTNMMVPDGGFFYTPFSGATDTFTLRSGLGLNGANQDINFYTADTSRGGFIAAGTLAVYYSVSIGNAHASNSTIYGEAVHASFTGHVVNLNTTRTAGNNFSFITAYTGSGGDLEFHVRGDGEVTADGAFTGGGADYAEYFETESGEPIAPGISVVLEGDKIRPATKDDAPALIIGIISVNPTIVGDAAWNRWSGKYLSDEFGAVVMEDYVVLEWEEVVEPERVAEHKVQKMRPVVTKAILMVDGKAILKEVDIQVPAFTEHLVTDEAGRPVMTTEVERGPDGKMIERRVQAVHQEPVFTVTKTTVPAKTKTVSYAEDALPDGVKPPANAKRTTQQRRKLNPAFDPTQAYISRENRPEWVTVGLMGKLRLRKGQPVGDRWIKMRDISDAVEEWLVR